MKTNKIILIAPYFSTFMKKDYEMLSKYYNIKFIQISKFFPIIMLKLIKDILWADLTFSWFADYHAYWAVKLSKFLKKKSIVVIGGYEVAKIAEIRYGLMLNPKSVQMVKYIFVNADKILTVDDGLKKNAIENTEVDGENIQTVPTGYNYKMYKPSGEKEQYVLTVNEGDYWDRIILKGSNNFVLCAKLLSDIKFLIIGVHGEALRKLKEIAPQNVEFIGPISQQELIPYYQKAKVYCQLSMREGLPNALCEAMLCECIPVGSDVQGVRTAIGDAGFLVPYGDAESTAGAIIKALKSDKGKDARERIIRMFPEEKREKELVKIIKEVLKDGR